MYYLIFLICLPAFGNTFELQHTGARFKLTITNTGLTYSSEGLKKTLELSNCSLRLAKELNAELIQALPHESGDTGGIPFLIDDKLIHLSGKQELLSKLLAMDTRVLRFIAEERTLCH